MNKKIIIIIVVVTVIVILGIGGGFAGWYFFLKKSSEGQACKSSNRCVEGTTCISGTCSSGRLGSVCSIKEDCKTNFCVSGKCTEGIAGSTCTTFKDCQDGLLCKSKTCTVKPSYTKYVSNIVISKMKPGLPPGINNPLTATTNFKTTDGIEIDFIGVKSTTVGEFHYEFINTTSGELAKSSKNEMVLSLNGKDNGTGTDLSNVSPGDYYLDIYFKNELINSVAITVSK